MYKKNFSGWLKEISHSSLIIGSDLDVKSKNISWRNSNLTDITLAGVFHSTPESNISVQIRGIGNFWQSDSYLAPFKMNSTVEGVICERRIEKQIHSNDRFIGINNPTEDELQIYFSPQIVIGESVIEVVEIPEERVGHWLIGEIDIVANKIYWYYSESRI